MEGEVSSSNEFSSDEEMKDSYVFNKEDVSKRLFKPNSQELILY